MRYRYDIGWNYWKTISRLISLLISLSADPNIMDPLQREHPQILAGIRVWYGENCRFSIFKPRIFEMVQDGVDIAIDH